MGEGGGAEVATVGRDSERGKDLQGAEYEDPGRKTWETRSERTGKAKEAKAERAAPRKPL